MHEDYLAAMMMRVAIMDARQRENENAAIAARRAAMEAARAYIRTEIAPLVTVGPHGAENAASLAAWYKASENWVRNEADLTAAPPND